MYFRIFLKTLVWLTILISGLMLAIWSKPEYFISKEWVQSILIDQAKKNEIDLKLKGFSFQFIPSNKFFSKNLEVLIQYAEAKKEESLKAQLEKLDLKVKIDFFPFDYQIHHLSIEDSNLEILSSKDPSPQTPQSTESSSFLQDFYIGFSQVRIPPIENLSIRVSLISIEDQFRFREILLQSQKDRFILSAQEDLSASQIKGNLSFQDGTVVLQNSQIQTNLSYRKKNDTAFVLTHSAHYQLEDGTQISWKECSLSTENNHIQLPSCLTQIDFRKSTHQRYLNKLQASQMSIRVRGEGQYQDGFWEVHLASETYQNDIFSLDGNATLRLTRPIQIQGEAHFQNSDIQKLFPFLEVFELLPPAPLNALAGPMKVDLQMKSDDHLSAKIQTRFEKQLQKLFLDGSLDLENLFSPNRTLRGEIELKDIALVAPPLGLSDRKISIFPTESQAPQAPSSLKISQIQIRSSSASSIRVFSDQLNEPLEAGLDLSLSSNGIQSFQLKLNRQTISPLKRKVTLKDVVLSQKGEEPLMVQGSFLVDYHDYKVHLQLSGPTSQPDLHLWSEPPLNERETLALLLFGRRIKTLEESEFSSVNDAQQAIGEGAMSLASLYLLASTPIQSVTYDSESETVDSKIGLRDDTVLVLGVGSKTKKIGLRQHLGKNWYLRGGSEKSEDKDRELSTFLEKILYF